MTAQCSLSLSRMLYFYHCIIMDLESVNKQYIQYIDPIDSNLTIFI